MSRSRSAWIPSAPLSRLGHVPQFSCGRPAPHVASGGRRGSRVPPWHAERILLRACLQEPVPDDEEQEQCGGGSVADNEKNTTSPPGGGREVAGGLRKKQGSGEDVARSSR